MCEDIEATERVWAAIDKMPENLRIQTAGAKNGLTTVAHLRRDEDALRFSEAFPLSSFDKCVLYATVKYFSLFGNSQARASASKHRILRTFDIHQKMLLR